LFVFAPNSTIWSFALRNHTHNVGRLVCFSVSLDAGADIDRARKVLVTIVSGLPGVMANPPPDIFVDAINAGAPSLACRFWARHEAVGEVQRQVLERARRGLEEADASLRPTHVARLVPPETDPSRLRA
jgi:small conductance mechanosensitive channel